MTKTILIFVRHGYSLANEQNIFAGITDVPLTEVGKEQARLTAHYLSRYAIDKLYSSDLQRAMQTAQPIAEQTGLAFIAEHDMTPEDMIDQLEEREKKFFRVMFGGKMAKKLYRLYEYKGD